VKGDRAIGYPEQRRTVYSELETIWEKLGEPSVPALYSIYAGNFLVKI
jgi:hypothetical protein